MYISKAFLFFIKKMMDDAGIPYLTSMEQYLFCYCALVKQKL